MGFFYKHNPKKFNYIPRYFDPDKEAWEKKKAELVMEPESFREKAAEADKVDEPTRVSGQLPDITDVPSEPTRADLPKVSEPDENVRDYFEEFFNKK